jgi:hypothetical protein
MEMTELPCEFGWAQWDAVVGELDRVKVRLVTTPAQRGNASQFDRFGEWKDRP